MSQMNKSVNLFLAFVFILLIAFFAVGFTSTVTAPNNTTTAGQQYENLSQTVSIADTGINAGILLIVIAFVLAAIYMIYYATKRH